MNNIFQSAYLGKIYKTKGEKRTIYFWNYTEGDVILHNLAVEGSILVHCYGDNGELVSRLDENYNITSEWYGPIDEENLDKSARRYAAEECLYDLQEDDVDTYRCIEDFKAGYREGWETNNNSAITPS